MLLEYSENPRHDILFFLLRVMFSNDLFYLCDIIVSYVNNSLFIFLISKVAMPTLITMNIAVT